jgi:hypothetical protein
LDLLVGPLEAATIEAADPPAEVSTLEAVELLDPAELPAWRDG